MHRSIRSLVIISFKPLLQLFWCLSSPGRFYCQNDQNGNKAYDHGPVCRNIGSGNGLGITNDETCKYNPEGAFPRPPTMQTDKALISTS